MQKKKYHYIKRIMVLCITVSMLFVAVPVLADTDKPTIYIAGDSVAQKYYAAQYPQTGWGQVFSDRFNDEITVDNRAISGRGTKRFENEGRLQKIFETIQPGDFLFIQFGIYETNKDNSEWNASVDDYKECLKTKYIAETIDHGAIPVLLTPCVKASWDKKTGKFEESRKEYSDATREVALDTGCSFIDINKIMTDTFKDMDKDEVMSYYMVCEPLESTQRLSGESDLSHFKDKGARLITKLIADSIPESVPELKKYLKQTEKFSDISGHWSEDDINLAQEKGFVSGRGDGKFAPDADVTRAEFLKMAMNASGILGHGYRAGECLEAVDSNWYCFYLQSALDKGFIPAEMTVTTAQKEVRTVAPATGDKAAVTANITSYMCGFKANLPITREEMTVIAINCLLYAADKTDKKLDKTDSKSKIDYTGVNTAYIEAVKDAYSYGLVKGMGMGSFKPKDKLTRAQAVAIVNRMAQMLE